MGKLMTSIYMVLAVGLTWGFATVFYGAGIGAGDGSSPRQQAGKSSVMSADDLPRPFADSASERARIEAQEMREKFQSFQVETRDRLKDVQEFRAAKEREVQSLKQAEKDLRSEAQMAEQVRRAAAEGWYKVESEHLTPEAIRAMHMAIQINRELDMPIFDVQVTDRAMSIAVKVDNLWSGRFPDQVRNSRRRALRSMAQLLRQFGEPKLTVEYGRAAAKQDQLVAKRVNELNGMVNEMLAGLVAAPRFVASADEDFDEAQIAMRLEVPNPQSVVERAAEAAGFGAGGDARSRAVEFVRGLFF
jgi:hypothetical protein